LYIELKQRKEDARKRQEAEKMENLAKKEAILEEIKKLTDDEETSNSLKRLKELQSEWKTIKNVPKEHVDRLWESYRVLNEIFYDRLSINNELKDLDRSKNLDHKIELISKVSELTKEDNIKKALISVKKYQEEWRFIGPVAREASDDIWNRFKAEVDKVYTIIKARTEEMELVRQTNLEAKKVLLDQAKALSTFQTQRIKELMEQWKKIGHVPMAVRDQVWNEFRDARNSFYANKNVFFKTMHAERNANLKAKEDLCIKAEGIAANPIDWNKQTDELKKLQEAWKKIGHAPDKVNDAVWKRFRSACDLFFEKKSERYASQQSEQIQNLAGKQALIEKLEGLSTAENTQNIFAELKQIQTDWNAIGFVPVAQKESVNKKYNDLLDKLYGKHKQLNRDMREDRDKQSFELLAGSPNGLQKLQREEKILQERIRGMKKDIETWDNNLGFFKSGNSKNPLAEQMQAKIEIAQKHIAGLEDKLKALKALKNKPAEEAAQ
jgi:peptidase E